MRERRPGFLNIQPIEYFARFTAPMALLFFVANYFLKSWQFGHDYDSFRLLEAVLGATIFEAVTFLICLLTSRRSVAGYFRFVIFYLAFVPHLSLGYITKLWQFSYLFEFREDLVNHKWSGLFALWSADWSGYLQLLVPMMILVLGARKMNGGEQTRFPLRYWVLLAVACFFLALMFLFSGIINLSQYMIAIILVYIISDSWEQVRRYDSTEPEVLVSWAEILMFAALWLKGAVEILG
ncbi:MAG: hypothetical protein K5891_08795 [Lachnospiraceae bacterium]|nr:hypothetical protein [Lachnospiraceae bacterium]